MTREEIIKVIENNCKGNLVNAYTILDAIDKYNRKEDYMSLILKFCHFIGECGYKINGWDDGQLSAIIERFLNIQSAPSAQ